MEKYKVGEAFTNHAPQTQLSVEIQSWDYPSYEEYQEHRKKMLKEGWALRECAELSKFWVVAEYERHHGDPIEIY